MGEPRSFHPWVLGVFMNIFYIYLFLKRKPLPTRRTQKRPKNQHPRKSRIDQHGLLFTVLPQIPGDLPSTLSHTNRLPNILGVGQTHHPRVPLPQHRLAPRVRQVGRSEPSLPRLVLGRRHRRDSGARGRRSQSFAGSGRGQTR